MPDAPPPRTLRVVATLDGMPVAVADTVLPERPPLPPVVVFPEFVTSQAPDGGSDGDVFNLVVDGDGSPIFTPPA